MKYLAIIALSILMASGALAHSKVDTTHPADGAELTAAPAEIELHFAKDIRLTRVEMILQDQTPIRLDLGEQTRFDKGFTLPLTKHAPGSYRIDWRGLSKDGHAMQGTFSYTVK